MPWCPKCRTEYQEGITVCADCGAALVDELPAEEAVRPVLAYISEEELAKKLVDYLSYSSIEADYAYDEKEESYAVYVDTENLSKAKVAFRAFYSVETKNEMIRALEEAEAADEEDGEGDASEEGLEIDEEVLESIPEEEMSTKEKEAVISSAVAEQMYKPAEVYVKKADESKEMFSTAITFLAFAILLLVFLVLNALDIVTIFNNVPSLIMLGVMAIGCCLVGINAIKRSRRAEVASVEEDKLTKALDNWLRENISDELFTSLADEDLGQEVLYLRRTELIKNELTKVYPDLDENYVDALIEDFYNEYFKDEEAAEDSEAEDNESEESEAEDGEAADSETEISEAADSETENSKTE